MAETLSHISAALAGTPEGEVREKLMAVLREMYIRHKRILFGGNGYTDEWVEEAARRGLDNLQSLPDAMPHWISEKSIDLLVKHGIFTEKEIFSRYDILLENYAKTIHIESLTMQDMVQKDFFEGLFSYEKDLTQAAAQKASLLPGIGCAMEKTVIKALDTAADGTSSIPMSTRILQPA